MLHRDDRFHAAVERAVGEVEAHTDAEVVVVVAERSGSYRDLARLWAAVGALLVLAAILFLPFLVHPITALAEVAVAWALLAWLLDGRRVLRLLAPASRRAAQVRTAAAAAFHEEAVHATPHRTGLLVYVSVLEGQVELLPDLGLQERIPPGRWAAVSRAFSHDDLDHFLDGLAKTGELLAAHVPKLERDAIDLPNAPRVRE